MGDVHRAATMTYDWMLFWWIIMMMMMMMIIFDNDDNDDDYDDDDDDGDDALVHRSQAGCFPSGCTEEQGRIPGEWLRVA